MLFLSAEDDSLLLLEQSRTRKVVDDVALHGLYDKLCVTILQTSTKDATLHRIIQSHLYDDKNNHRGVCVDEGSSSKREDGNDSVETAKMVELDLYRVLQLTSLHLLLAKAIENDNSTSYIETTTIEATVRQCDNLISLLQPMMATTSMASSSSSCQWQRRTQQLCQQHPFLCQHLVASMGYADDDGENNSIEEEEEENLLLSINKEELALEEQNLLQMAHMPVPLQPLEVKQTASKKLKREEIMVVEKEVL